MYITLKANYCFRQFHLKEFFGVLALAKQHVHQVRVLVFLFICHESSAGRLAPSLCIS